MSEWKGVALVVVLGTSFAAGCSVSMVSAGEVRNENIEPNVAPCETYKLPVFASSLALIKTTIDKFCARLECQSWNDICRTLRGLHPKLENIEKSSLTLDDIESLRKFSKALTKLLYDLYYLREDGGDLTSIDDDCDELIRDTEAIAYTLTLPS